MKEEYIDIIVEGGVVQDVIGVPSGICVRVIDYDTDGEDLDRISKSPYGADMCILSEYRGRCR